MALGILYALFSTVEYRSKAEVLPEVNNSSQGAFSQLLQSYGGFLGITNFGAARGGNNHYISPQLYPVVVHSLSFQKSLLENTVYFSDIDSSMTLFQYFAKENRNVEASVINTAKLDAQSNINLSDISSLTKLQMSAIDEMRQRVDLRFADGTGVMKVKAVMPDAVAAAQVCSQVIERLKMVVKKYHTRKAKKILEYANKQYKKAKEEFLQAQHKLATFKDEHSNLVTASAQSKLKYLRSKYNLAYNVYNSAAQRQISARMNLQKSIPVFNMLQYPNIPLHPYSPQWIPIILISIAVGLVLSFLVVAGLFVVKTEFSTM